MTAKTYLAVGELVQAAAHLQGIVGPVEYYICTDKGLVPPWFDSEERPANSDINSRPVTEKEFFYEQHAF